MRLLMFSLVLMTSWACSGTIVAPTERRPVGLLSSVTVEENDDEATNAREEAPPIQLPAAVACEGTSVGRSYRGFAGEALDAQRKSLAAGQDLARVRDGTDLQVHFENRGIAGASVNRGDAQSFGMPPERWFESPTANFGTVYRTYALGFEGCLKKVKVPDNYHPFGHADYSTPPTADSSGRQCQVMSKMLWRREMNAEELTACVEYAQTVHEVEPVTQRQWAYVCAAVTGSAPFVIY